MKDLMRYLPVLFVLMISTAACAQVPNDRPPAAGAPTMDVLKRLEARGKNLADFTADVTLSESDPITARTSTRTGVVFYQRKPDGDARIRVRFDTRKASGPMLKEHLEYVLDNGVLVDQNYQTRLQVTRQVLKPGQKLNPLKLGEGPFPLPIGQAPEEVLKNFSVKLVPPSKDDPAETDHLQLTPKDGTRFARKFDTIDVWVNRKDGFTPRIETQDKDGGTVRTTELTNVKVNAGLKDSDFKLPEPGKDWGVRNEELGD